MKCETNGRRVDSKACVHYSSSPIDLYVDKDVSIPTLLCVLKLGGCRDSVYDERSGGEGGLMGGFQYKLCI